MFSVVTEINAVRSLNIISLLCYFHFLQANERAARKYVPDHQTRVQILDMIRALNKCNIESQFRHLLTKLKALATIAFWNYFQNTYICCNLRNDHIGPHLPSCICATRGWANIGERSKYPSVDRDETTNLIEHFFKKFKNDFLDRRIHRRLSDLHQLNFDEVIPHYLQNMMKKKANRIKSHHQHLINTRQHDVEELLIYDNAICHSLRYWASSCC